MQKSTKEHWDTVYASTPVQRLGWYEPEPILSLEMIENCAIDIGDPILDVGAGSTTLIDSLIQRNYKNITALDISAAALKELRNRLDERKATQVNWLVADITQPAETQMLHDSAIWHDRAMLHFLTDEAARQAYLTVLKKVLRPGGFAIIAVFSKEGATQCSGLDVQRYDENDLGTFLGSTFELKESRDYDYLMPSGGVRSYLYVRFRRRV